MNSRRDELLEKLMQIEEHARSTVGEDARLVAERMKFIARLASYLRTQLRLYWSQDFDLTVPLDEKTEIPNRRA
jgi:hypothetical protein